MCDGTTRLLEIELNCPQCGGNQIWTEQQRLNRCSFCGSMLYFERGGQDRFYIEPRVKSVEQVKGVIVQYKAERKRSEDMATCHENQEHKEFYEGMPLLPLAPYLERYEREVAVEDAHLVFVPYWHFRATVVHSLLAETAAGKEYSLRRVPVDEALAGYDAGRWNFRDRGLRLGEARLKIATRKMLSENRHVAFSDEPIESHFGRLVKAYPPGEENASYLFRSHVFCHTERLPVFRAYWICSYLYGALSESALIDASFGTIAGYPGPEETARLLRYADRPYEKQEQTGVRIVASRCPVCGWDVSWTGADPLHVCTNCSRALTLKDGEIHVAEYLYAPAKGESFVYAPFWKFAVDLQLAGKSYGLLADYFRQFFAERMLRSATRGDSLFIPAAKIRKIRQADAFFAALVVHAGTNSQELLPGPIAGGNGQVHCLPVELSDKAARELLNPSLPSASGVPPGLQKLVALKQMLNDTSVRVKDVSLVLLPLAIERSDVLLGNRRYSTGYFAS